MAAELGWPCFKLERLGQRHSSTGLILAKYDYYYYRTVRRAACPSFPSSEVELPSLSFSHQEVVDVYQ